MCSIASLSWYDVYKFWVHVKCLWDELDRQGVDERIVKVRGMLLALVTAIRVKVDEKGKGKGIRIIVVDENGEMINGKGEEMVQLLCQSDEEEEERDILMAEIKNEGFSNVLRRRWTINHKIHPHHLLVRVYRQLFLKDGLIPEVRCDACFCVIDYKCTRYRCSVCEKYEMCQRCFEC
ncbi:hypothetical protein SUGI_0784220 [Cryptomeria japonica]|nr:hypothetical protein SUGI_0784220 [Cryptomeria japonica]